LRLEGNLLVKRSVSRYENIKSPSPDKPLLENIAKNLNWQYQFKDCASIKAKQSVSSLVHAGEQFAEADFKFSFESFENVADKTNSLVIGSATHLIIQNIDLKQTFNESVIHNLISDLVKKGCLTKQTAEKINISSIMKFLNSDLGRLIQNSKNTVMKEWPFTYAAPAADIYPNLKNCGDEKIIVQGIIDMLVKTPDEAVIIDFKTDHISSMQVQQRAELYLPQLRWYCKAAGDILNVKKLSGWLYFLAPAAALRVYSTLGSI
jgi:ATP-dependent helicase/nuclease subunit A